MKTIRYILLLLALGATADAWGAKREFRGAWLHTVFQSQYHTMTTAQNKAAIISRLDSLKAAGINAVIFQVRPQADAFYASKIEPWSRYLTDGGKAPVPFWDPLAFIIDEAHQRGMELHAWLNPYRITAGAKQVPERGHIALKHPERTIRYDGKLYFDPALPQNRQYIASVVDDIVARYDIDGIHFDDYFYPYPVKGKPFPDDASYSKYGGGMARDDWRRHNVDLLIEDISARIHHVKPWVRFGVSPFGIWRNKTTDPRGSDTNGLENYDGLYADVLLWEERGWVDYLMPQLYWEIDHKAASYATLLGWWQGAAGSHRHLYIGQDVKRTVDKTELHRKLAMAGQSKNIQGHCWWPGYEITRNAGGVADSLATKYHRCRALPPQYPWLYRGQPAAVENLCVKGRRISWPKAAAAATAGDVVRHAIYRFDSIDDIADSGDLPDEALFDITGLDYFDALAPGCYIITAIDRTNNESAPSSPVVIL